MQKEYFPVLRKIKDILEKSLTVETLLPDETAALLNVKDEGLWDEMKETAVRIKKKVYDNRIVTFAPLYLGNYCVNNCLYCGFKTDNTEAKRRGLERADKVVVVADGARYNWEIAALHFHGCIEIVDLYHAREHLYELCALLKPKGSKEFTKLEMQMRTWLDEGKVETIIAKAERLLPEDEDQRDEVQKQIGYFRNNAKRMRYGHFREQGLFVGSGVVEAGCKTVVGKRLKQSGMEWTVRGANAIIALRCCLESGDFDDFWESRQSTRSISTVFVAHPSGGQGYRKESYGVYNVFDSLAG